MVVTSCRSLCAGVLSRWESLGWGCGQVGDICFTWESRRESIMLCSSAWTAVEFDLKVDQLGPDLSPHVALRLYSQVWNHVHRQDWRWRRSESEWKDRKVRAINGTRVRRLRFTSCDAIGISITLHYAASKSWRSPCRPLGQCFPGEGGVRSMTLQTFTNFLCFPGIDCYKF